MTLPDFCQKKKSFLWEHQPGPLHCSCLSFVQVLSRVMNLFKSTCSSCQFFLEQVQNRFLNTSKHVNLKFVQVDFEQKFDLNPLEGNVWTITQESTIHTFSPTVGRIVAIGDVFTGVSFESVILSVCHSCRPRQRGIRLRFTLVLLWENRHSYVQVHGQSSFTDCDHHEVKLVHPISGTWPLWISRKMFSRLFCT